MIARASGHAWRVALFASLSPLLAPAADRDSFIGRPEQTYQLESEIPLRMPTAVAIAPDGGVFVADGVNDRIVVFERDGRFREEIRSIGQERLSSPVGLKIDSSSRAWIADTGNHRVIVRAADGTLERVINAPPADAAPPPDITDLAPTTDAVWLIDNDNHRLLQYEFTTSVWRVVGRRGEALGHFQYPFLVAAGADGDLLVTDVINSRVQTFNVRGDPVATLGVWGVDLGQLYRPGGIAADRNELIWVADSVLGVVQAFRRSGELVDVLRDDAGEPLRLTTPLGLAFDQQGSLYVVELRSNRVRRFSISSVKRDVVAPPTQRPRVAGGQQAKACRVCHLGWAPPFAEGRDSDFLRRPIETPNDPHVAREESCLSCHDGSVADSRRRVWLEHGHNTGVTPPAAMAVPASLPLIKGQLACRTCHTAHGPGSQSDISRAVLVRGEPGSGELCMACHTDHTQGPARGSHPVGRMPHEIPDQLVAAGARRAAEPMTLTCQVCHTPHGSRHDALLIFGQQRNDLCIACHSEMAPGMFREGRPPQHPPSPPLDANQLRAVRELDRHVGEGENLVCLSCHRMHDGPTDRFLLADRLNDGQMCVRCHEPQRVILGSTHDLRTSFPQERNRLGMLPSDGGPCSACHLFHDFARDAVPSDVDPRGQCITCHQSGACAENRALTAINHPSAACVDCHNPHEAQFGHYLAAAPKDLCAGCHSQQQAVFTGAHNLADATIRTFSPDAPESLDLAGCLACHRPHGNDQTGLYRVAPASDMVASDGACVACHPHTRWNSSNPIAALHPRIADEAARASGLPLLSDPHDSAGRWIACATCHDPHAGSNAATPMLRTDADAGTAALCINCHTDAASLALSAHAPARLAAHGLDSASCRPCHQVHGAPSQTAAELLWPRELLSSPGTSAASSNPDYTFDGHCVSCHREGGGAKAPRIATHPDVPIFDPRHAAPDALPLFGAANQPSPTGRITCRTCHLPHGRALAPEEVGGLTANGGADRVRFARLQLRPFAAPNACTNCHGESALRRYLYFHDPARRTED